MSLVGKFKDNKVLGQLKSHDKEAFVKVYDENVSDIYRFVYFKIGRKDEAHDLTSAVFLKAWNHIQTNSLESAKTLRALLYKVARNVIIDYYRDRSGRQPLSLDDEANPIDLADESQDQAGQADQAADLELIRKKLPLLKEEYREVIIMRFVNDLSLEEMADISGKNKGNIRVLLHRALKALKELVEEEMRGQGTVT